MNPIAIHQAQISIIHLPEEIFTAIASKTGDEYFKNLFLTCTQWNAIMSKDTWWKFFVSNETPKYFQMCCHSNKEIVLKTIHIVSAKAFEYKKSYMKLEKISFSQDCLTNVKSKTLSKEKYSIIKSYVNTPNTLRGINSDTGGMLCGALNWGIDISGPLQHLLELGLDPNGKVYNEYPLIKNIIEMALSSKCALKAAKLLIDFDADTTFSITKHNKNFDLFSFAKYTLPYEIDTEEKIDALEAYAAKRRS